MGINTHNCNLLISVNGELLSIGLGLVDLLNGISSDLVHHNLLLTLGISDQYRSSLLCLGLGNLFVSIGFELLLFLIDLGSSDLLLELIELSLIDSLEISELLLLLVIESQLLILLLFLVILELNLQPGLLLKCPDKLRIDNNIGDVALFKLDSILLKLSIEIMHHLIRHV